jgi:hypothetical protein
LLPQSHRTGAAASVQMPTEASTADGVEHDLVEVPDASWAAILSAAIREEIHG